MRTMYLGSGSNLLLRTDVLNDINGYDESFVRNQDIEFLVRVAKKYKIAYVDEILLVIHQDGERKKRSFAEVDEYAKYYLKVFEKDINELDNKDQERVRAVISLERFRVALVLKEFVAGFQILRENKVRLNYFFKYVRYLFVRMVTHTSYGFDGR